MHQGGVEVEPYTCHTGGGGGAGVARQGGREAWPGAALLIPRAPSGHRRQGDHLHPTSTAPSSYDTPTFAPHSPSSPW